jgi:hypothetical protein
MKLNTICIKFLGGRGGGGNCRKPLTEEYTGNKIKEIQIEEN